MRYCIWFAGILLLSVSSYAETDVQKKRWFKQYDNQLGPRPFYLLNDMDEGDLKSALKQCENKLFYRKTDFSIGHRGAPLQFPEHTRESYTAAAKMGAGIVECDVTFTKDKQLVCRHSQCDLHTTTNILAIPELASKCSEPFTPVDKLSGRAASAKCCTSDISLQEFKSLCGKMDASNPQAESVDEYLKGTADWRTDVYSSCGTLMTHKESIELFKQLGVKMTPELKSPSVDMPFEGDYSQADYAQHMIDEYREAHVSPRNVYPQSFSLEDILYWIDHEPYFARQAVYLDSRVYEDPNFRPTLEDMTALKQSGVNIIAPPMWALLTVDDNGNMVPSDYARFARQAGLKIITWTLERDGPLANGGSWYHKTISELVNNDGDTYQVLDVLAQQVGVVGVFSDWPATTSYYANCMNLR